MVYLEDSEKGKKVADNDQASEAEESAKISKDWLNKGFDKLDELHQIKKEKDSKENKNLVL